VVPGGKKEIKRISRKAAKTQRKTRRKNKVKREESLDFR
jgi:hypothetical protein